MNSESSQKIHKNNVIICKNCASLAMATLEGRHLCAGCLLRELMSAGDSTLFDRLMPLPTDTRPLPASLHAKN